MIWFLVAQIFSVLISLIQIGRLSESEKDLEIMVLRYQLGIAERKLHKPVRANHAERSTTTTLGDRIKVLTNNPPFPVRNQSQRARSNVVKYWVASSTIIIGLLTTIRSHLN